MLLGVRLAILGLQKLGIDDSRGRGRKRLVTFVEIDRCVTDAVGFVTGRRLGKRTLKFRDWERSQPHLLILKPDAQFVSRRKKSSKAIARRMHPKVPDKNQQQMLAYREMADDDLFTTQSMKIELSPEEFPGYKDNRIVCDSCGEGINFRREVRRTGKVLCRSCTGERYYEPA